MRVQGPAAIHAAIEQTYRNESRRVLATLIRLLGNFDLAEEALQEAFSAAMDQWPGEGVPENPRAWLISTGRFRAIDRTRRRKRLDEISQQLALDADESDDASSLEIDERDVEDDHLRLIFTCCHPALAPEAQIALTLREVCGLTTEEIAAAFLGKPATLAQRIVRAKNKIRDAGIPYEIPGARELPERLDQVLRVIYLVYNEGYSASAGDKLLRADLSDEAIRLGRLLVQLLPEPEAMGLLALMLLQDSRRAARSNADGDLILLEDQDRSLWNQAQIAEGCALVEQSLRSRRIGPYTLQAAIAAVHAEAPSAAQTDWAQIAGLYEVLQRASPSPVVDLNHAIAVAMHRGPAEGLSLLEPLTQQKQMQGYHLLPAARADLLRRMGRVAEAIQAYEQALALAQQAAVQRYLQKRITQLRAELKG